MNIYEGDLIIRNADDADKYKGLTKVTGYLYIHTSAKLDALTSVGGTLSIHAPAKLDALTSVGGWLSIYAPATKLDALTSVGGWLSIYAPATKLDALTSVGGDLSIYASAKLDALTSVGGWLSIGASAKLDANKLYTGGYSKFTMIDGIGCVVSSEKQQGDITVLMCRYAKIKDQKLVGDKFYVARKGGDNAHGKTIGEATKELLFKIGSRDVSQYRNLPKGTAKSPSEWALIYRTVTGACQFGTRHFMESQGVLKKKYTLSEILSKTKGQWGHEKFSEVVSGGSRP